MEPIPKPTRHPYFDFLRLYHVQLRGLSENMTPQGLKLSKNTILVMQVF